MLKNLKLTAKFSLMLVVVFIGGIIISGAALSKVLEQRAEREVSSQAAILIKAMNAVRAYTSERVNPLLAPKLETEPVFIPETVPAYSATEVFENLRKNEEYRNFFYKEATLNPTNLRDKADAFEAKIVERFRNESNTKEISGFRNLPGGEVFYIARPLAISKESCLRCHSTPEAAPKSQIATYGSEWGFGWKLNEIVAAQIISVPSSEIFESSRRSLSLVMGILFGIFTIVVLWLNFFLKRSVIQPIKKMSRTAERVSTGEMSADFEQNSNDEIGILAASFNRMKSSLEIAMKLLSQQTR
ncbi:histidine kinase [cyanobacterium TDX16]|nr:histidine kinase [cyanobacterium TDX16]